MIRAGGIGGPDFHWQARAIPRWSAGVTLSAIGLVVLGVTLLVCGAEFLVRGASRIAVAAGVSPLVIGLTVVSFGTSSPELAVSVASAYGGEADLALGNIVGSNIANLLVILGLSALVVPLVVAHQLVRFDVPLMIGVSILMWIMGLDGNVGRIDGIVLFAGVVAYTVHLIRDSRRSTGADVKAEYEAEFGGLKAGSLGRNIGLAVLGLAGLVGGSHALVNGAVSIAEAMGVSELVIGLTVVAIGTSMPEIATSVVAAVRGERDIAVGNAIGSNLFNILCVLGLSATVSPAGIPVDPAALHFDIPVMIGVSAACLPLFFHGYRIGRLTGLVFLIFYACYLVHIVLNATNRDALVSYESMMGRFVLPATGLVLVVLTVLGFRARATVGEKKDG